MAGWTLNPSALSFSSKSQNAKTRPHDEVLAQLVMLIREIFSDAINYDHVNLPIPHFPISLKFGEKYVDIAFIYNDRIFYIQLDSRKLDEKALMEGGICAGSEEPHP
jgi:hypothetical protein